MTSPPPEPGRPERRSAERVPFEVPVSVVATGGTRIRGVTLDLATGGALVALEQPIALGEAVLLTLYLPDGGSEVTIAALAARHGAPFRAGERPSVGFAFLMPPPELAERLRSLLFEATSTVPV